MMSDSPFFRLPAEIRERILRYALTPDDTDFLMTGTAQFPEILFRTYEKPLPAAMSTCKKMYREMSPWALTEIIIRESIEGSSIRTGIRCHGNLRYERLRHVSMVIAIENSNFISPSWSPFLLGLLKHSTNVDSLDIEFYKNDFQKEVESELSAAEERRLNGEERDRDLFILKYYAQPEWLEEIARQPSLRRVSFEGNVPRIWLERLRRESRGRIQVFSDGIRFREKEQEWEMNANNGQQHKKQRNIFAGTENRPVSTANQSPQFQVVYVPASRYD